MMNTESVSWTVATGAPNVWVRALTYATFGKRCGRAWAERLLKDLKRLNGPVPADEFQRLFRTGEPRGHGFRRFSLSRMLMVSQIAVAHHSYERSPLVDDR
jgi:hypothetical protein